MKMLYDIYNPGSTQKFLQKIQYQGEWQDSVTLQSIQQLGLTTKDVIGPDSFTFKADKVLLGTKIFARTYYVSMIPTWLRGDAFTDLSELPCNMLVSVHYRTLPQDIGSKLIKSYRVNINSNVADAEKSASRAGYSMDLISQELLDSRTEVKNLTNDITKRNQKIVMASIVLTVFTSSEKELEKMDKQISMIANKHQMQIRVLSLQQEYGLATALPVGMNKIAVERLMTTETAAMLIPFSVKELNHKHGMYYGLNAESYGMIRYDRTKGQNYNNEGILHHEEGVDIIPTNIELSGMEISLVNAMSREQTLKLYLADLKKDYDYILIDCMPSLEMLTINALAAADSVIVPVQAHYLPLKGMTQLMQTIGKVQRQLNPNLKIEGVLLTLADMRTKLASTGNTNPRDTGYYYKDQ